MVKTFELEQEGTVATIEEHQKAMYHLLVAFDKVCRKLNIQYFLFSGTLLGAVRHHGFIPWDDDLDVLMLRADYERLMREAPGFFEKENLFLQQEYSEHYPMFFSKLRINETTCLEPYYPKDDKMHQGVYMDIFPCDNAYNSKIGRWIQFAASKVVIAKSLDAEGYVTNSMLKKVVMCVSRCLLRAPFQRIVRGPKKQNKFVHSFLGGSSRMKRSVYPSNIFSESIELPFEGGFFLCPQRYDLLLKILYGDYMEIPAPEDRKCKKHAILVDLKNSYEKYAGYRDNILIEHSTRSIR